MIKFNYLARDTTGKSISGVLTALSPGAASKQLRQEGKFLIRLLPADGSAARPDPSSLPRTGPQAPSPGATGPAGPAGLVRFSNRRISRQDVIYLTTQLAVMTDTGVPLADGLDSVKDQCTGQRLRTVLADISQRVKAGEEFSTALARHARVFPPMYVAMVRAAEASGTLGVMLDRVATHLADEYETRKKVVGALTYPAAMITFALAVTVFLIAFVLPRFVEIYANQEAALPLPTRIVMGISSGLVNNWIWIVSGLLAAIVGAVSFLRKDQGRRWWARVKLRLPLLGNIFRQLQITRCLRTLGTLIGTGVPMLESVQITRQVAGLGPFGELWDEVDAALRTGQQLSDTLFKSPIIPRSVAQMIAAGEKTGKLPEVMERLAAFSDRDLKNKIKTSTALIEPIMIVVMGAIIGVIVMALLLPIFNISKVITQGNAQ